MGQPSEPVRLLPHARLLVTTILRYLSKTCVSSATTERRVRTASCPSLSMLGQHLANRSRSPHATSRRGKSKTENRRADSNCLPLLITSSLSYVAGVLHRLANTASLEGFPFSTLLRVAP